MATIAQVLGHICGAAFVTYFVVYPILYFVWNFGIEGVGFPEYKISNFWAGMAIFAVVIISKNILTGEIKKVFTDR